MQLRHRSAALLAAASLAAASLAALTGCTGAGTAAVAAARPVPATAGATAMAAPVPSAATPTIDVTRGSTIGSTSGSTRGSTRGMAALSGLGSKGVAADGTAPAGGVGGAAARPAVAAPADRKPVRGGRLAGLTIVLDPGHNGGNAAQPHRLNALVPAGGFSKPCNTAGAETNAGYPEHAFTWDVVTRAAALLKAAGARVVLTRHSDTGFGPCVNERAAIGNAAHADAVVAVHADGAASSAYGFHVIAPGLAPDGGNRSILTRSWALALAMHAQFHDVSGEPSSTYVSGGLVKRTDLAGLNLSRVPAIFIECANMRNASDARRLTSPAWRQKAAAGIVAGLTAYLRR